MTIRNMTIVGARPQFVKAAAVSRAMRRVKGITEIMVHTGQHFDSNMSDIFFKELGIPSPDYFLDIHGGGHGEMTGRMLAGLEDLMVKERPDWVLVYGDTNSTLAGALAAAKLHIPVAHVEAGLRSNNRKMPEEVNRVLTDHLSTLLFCPTSAAVANLRDEGISKGVQLVGDVMYDATLAAIENSRGRGILDDIGVKPGCYSVATVHRAENTDDSKRLSEILEFLRSRGKKSPVVLPLHPRTRSAIQRNGFSVDGLILSDPLGYLDMAKLLSECSCVFTDSGGLQKEAYFHRKPCVTLREETEWVETIENGWNRLWKGPDYAPRRVISEYGSGNSSDIVVNSLIEFKDSGR